MVVFRRLPRPSRWKRLFGRSPEFRALLWEWIVPLLFAAALVAASVAGAFRLSDGYFFDLVTGFEPGRDPKVVLVEQDEAYLARGAGRHAELASASSEAGAASIGFRDGREIAPRNFSQTDTVVAAGFDAEPVPASTAWALETGPDPLSPAIAASATLIAPAQYGIYRRQMPAIEGPDGPIPTFETALAGAAPSGETFYVRMPRAQNIPRITATQLLDRSFAPGELEGLRLLVPPASEGAQAKLTTPLDPGARSVTASVFSAYAVQALAEGRGVTLAPLYLVVLALVAFCVSTSLLFRRVDAKRFLAPVVIVVSFVALVCAAVLLVFGNVLAPVTAIVIGIVGVSLWQVIRRERIQDIRLNRVLERAINLSFGRAAFQEQRQIPVFLRDASDVLGFARSMVFAREGQGKWQVLAARDAELGELALETRAARQVLREASLRRRSVAGQDIAPWEGETRIVSLSEPDAETEAYWLFNRPRRSEAARAPRLAEALALSVRQMQRWRDVLLGGNSLTDRYRPVDERVSAAATLITVQGEQVRQGLDALDTAVMVFHLVGFPIQANATMDALYESAGLPRETTSLRQALLAFTELEEGQVDGIIRDLVLNGGEMRVPMRDFGTRQRMLRIAAPDRVARDWERVIVMEAVDISELDQLAELRLAVGMFIDQQLRNDLEAINLGAAVASDPRIAADKLTRVVGRIRDVAARATDRLEQVSDLLSERPEDIAGASYPIDARKAVATAIEKAEPFAEEMQVTIGSKLPGISGFTVAEPQMLTDMVEAMLRLVIADTPAGSQVDILLEELDGKSFVRVSGGFGTPFERLMAAFDAGAGETLAEFQIISAGIREALGWGGAVSYWSAVGKGYKFNIQMRRIG